MEVKVVESTDNPEKLICQSGRGDYYSGFIGETDYEELMETVNCKDYHLEEEKTETDAKTRAFIEKQASRGHWGLWEHPQITFTVKGVSRVTMAQIARHRHMSFDIQSMRYVDFSDGTEITTPKSLTDPDHFTRETGEIPLEEDEQSHYREIYEEKTEEIVSIYEEMVEAGVPKEDARFLLPLGTEVNMTFSGNARTMLHVLNLRQKPNAQWEIRNLSKEIVKHLEDWIPYTAQWWEENGPMKISP